MAHLEDSATILANRHSFAEGRLNAFADRVAQSATLAQLDNLCIYVCGSYGRIEASPSSDLDLFFIEDDRTVSDPVSRLDSMLVSADIIRCARDMRFPEFSNDGEYLQTHSLKSILAELGGRTDDYANFFTARLLFLLESRPIYGQLTYNRVLRGIVDAYYRDYHDHIADFKPIFLINDIIRFWKTLCLNYEHRRNREATNSIAKSKHHLRNLKLKFSRLLSCYGTVIPLIARPESSPDDVMSLLPFPPLERLSRASDTDRYSEILAEVRDDYVWFLEEVTDPEILNNLVDRKYRDKVFGRGRDFASEIYSLLKLVSDEETLRYLTV
jgi:hypothetical protein